MARQILSPALWRELLRYDAESGVLYWRVSPSKLTPVGSSVLSVDAHGYLFVKLFGLKYAAHRVAWAMHHDEHPAGEIDHINGDRADNRLANLRDVPKQINAENRRVGQSNNLSSGMLGVSLERSSGLWKAQIGVGGRNLHIGRFPTKAEAHEAYLREKRRFHPGGTL